MSEAEEAMMELLAEVIYSLDLVIRDPAVAHLYPPLVAKAKSFLMTYRPDLMARLYDR